MSYFAVIREAGRGWDTGKTMREQPGWGEHAAFMDALVDDGFVVCGGPLAGSDEACVRALLVVQATSEAEIRRRLNDDPWTQAQLLTTRVDSWELVMGPDRMAAATKAPRS